ncbi:MAG: hypothetical protein E7598_08930 [Ruminococcaceae bacterium]|nr:hypothetical protein [Oscillospiraceae bacterium]
MKIKIPNKKFLFGSIVAAVITSFLAIGIANITMTANISKKIAETKPAYETHNVQAATIPKLPSKAIYRLYECGGKIGIYDAESDILIDIIDVLTSTLPKNDRLALKKGIDICTFTELSKIIDDFSS